MHGAIFDMDGLLIDSERLWQEVWHELAAERGITLTERFAAEVCGTGGKQTLAAISHHFPGADLKELMRECSRRAYRREEDGVPLKKGARTILAGLRGMGCRLALASSSPMDRIEHVLGLAGVLDCFEVVASGREVPNGKPAPDVFLLAAERLGAAPEACYVFEDSLSGVEAGWRSGARTIMVPDLVPPTARERERCFGIYRDLDEAWESIRA